VDCVAVVDQVIALLRQRGRLTYRTLQLQFQLDEAHLEALKEEIISGQRLAVDEAGVEDVPQLCQVLWGLYYFHVVRAELHTVREVSGNSSLWPSTSKTPCIFREPTSPWGVFCST
jgi:hypothetical protein